MKNQLLVVLVTLFLAAEATLAQSSVRMIHITVDTVVSHPKTKDNPDKKTEDKSVKQTHNITKKRSEQRSLVIKLQNMSEKKYTGLTVRHTIFAQNTASHDISVASSGEQTVDLGTTATTTVQTPPATLTWTEESSIRSNRGKGSKKGSASSDKKKEEEGSEFVGYVVQVLQNGTVLAEEFTQPDMRKKMDSAPTTPKASSKGDKQSKGK